MAALESYWRKSYKRWLRWLALALIFSVACGFLSNWQLNRREQVVKVIQRIERNYDHQRVRLTTLVPSLHEFKPSREYRKVWVQGRYLNAGVTLVRNRPLNGVPGFEELVPFQIDSSADTQASVIWVDRGWLPLGETPEAPKATPLPKTGSMLVVGRLLSSEAADSRSAPRGQTQSIYLLGLAKTLGAGLHLPVKSFYSGAYLQLVQESEPGPTGTLADKPSLDEGNHLSYAFQWVIFAIMAFVALGWAIKSERTHLRAAQDPNFVPKKRKVVGQADMNAEDDLLDS